MSTDAPQRPLATRLSRPACADLGAAEPIQPIVSQDTPLTRAAWEDKRRHIAAQWETILGRADLEPFERTARLVRRLDLPDCDAAEFLLPTTATSMQRVVLMLPRKAAPGPLPAAVIPYYNPDLMTGYDLDSGELQKRPNVHFGRHLVQLGFAVVCGQAFPFNTVEDPGTGASFAIWHAAADELHRRYPDWTGMGRLIHDTRIAVDFLLDKVAVDPQRVLIMGHSLGGKMAFYTGCLDPRISAIIASDFGIAFASTNWDAPWYLGPQIHEPEFPLAHHHLLALAAPKPFLIVAGDCDGPRSWQYIDAVRPIYALHGRDNAMGILDHASGHSPPAEAVQTAYRWLGEQLGMQLPECRI